MNVNLKKLICPVVFCLVAALPVSGERTFSGKVVDREAQTPVEGAAVVLLSLPDSIYCGGMTTDSEGKFSISTEEANSDYLLKATSLGFFPLYQKATAGENIISLEINSNELDEITVEKFRSSIKTIPGGFSFDPKDYLKISTDVIDMLAKVPFVETRMGEITGITGKSGLLIYFNGKDPHIDLEHAMALLRTMDPAQIKSVELIMDPGASFKADFKGAIININFLQPFEGLLGSVLGFANLSPALGGQLHGALLYSKGKFNITGAVMAAADRNKSKSESRYEYFDTGNIVEDFMKHRGHNNRVSLKISAGYDFSSKSRLEAILNSQIQYSHSVENSLSRYILPDGSVTERFGTIHSRFRNMTPYIDAKLYYTLKTDSKGSYLEISGGYGNADNGDKNDYLNFNGDISHRKVTGTDQSVSASAKYAWKLCAATTLSAGYNFSFNKTTSTRIDPLNDVFLRYKDVEHGIFANLETQLSSSVGLTAGIRAENVHKTFSFPDNSFQSLKTGKWGFSPNLSLSWTINPLNSIVLSARREVKWPLVWDMAPIKWWVNENTYRVGNYNIKPFTAYNGELYYTFRNNYGAMVSGSYVDDFYQQIMRPGDSPNTMMQTSQMMNGHIAEFNASIFASALLFNQRWYMNYSIGYGYINANAWTEGYARKFSDSSFAFTMRQQALLWPAQWLSFDLGFSLSSPMSTFDGYDGKWRPYMSLGLTKQFRKGKERKGYISVTVDDITNWQPEHYVKMPAYSYFSKNSVVGVGVSLRFVYYFGNTNVRRNEAFEASKDIK